MKAHEKVILLIVLIFIAALAGLNYSAQASGLQLQSSISLKSVECWNFGTQSACTTLGNSTCNWKTDKWGSWCERPTCFDGDATNVTYCEYTLRDFNLSCGWEIYGTNLCDPNGTTSKFFGSVCSDYNNDQQSCYNSFWCTWNATNSTCLDPDNFGGGDNFVPVLNPSCGVLFDQSTCKNITGCTWNTGSSTCSGNDGGIACSQLNKSICSDVTFLSTCCNHNGTSCKSTMEASCYDGVSDLAAGKMFCEDYLVSTNKTACEENAGPPWYLPCKWDNSSQECHFNSDAFGGGSSFDEIGTSKGCEAQNGVWKTEQYTVNNVVKTDSWCEFKFGFEFSGGGNCDTACWSCETSVSKAKGNTSSQAESLCENSDLGYCDFKSDSNAPNGLGWCNPKVEFVQGGGKSCKSECSACDNLIDPFTQCKDSIAGCAFVNDTSASNGVGYCYGKNQKRCDTDCWSCFDSTACSTKGDGGNGACVWDSVNLYCKPSGFSGEVCFDGKDNDGDAKTDCADADCSMDKFCGGEDLEDGFGGVDCPFFENNATCIGNGCVWLVDHFDDVFGGDNKSEAGFCEFPGAQCWQHDDNSSLCNATSGCGWIVSTDGFCEENSTLFDNCFDQRNQTSCTNVAGCGWVLDPFSNFGRCDHLGFSQCFANSSRRTNETNCEKNETVRGTSTQICSWFADPYIPEGGFCEAACFSLSSADCIAKSTGLCNLVTGICEPTSFGGACVTADGNKTKCTQDFNATCSWFEDFSARNNVSNGTTGNWVTPSGWCDPKGAGNFVNFMGDIEPVIIGVDDQDSVQNASYNIEGVGIRDEFDKLVLGTRVEDKFANSTTCNNVPVYNDGALGTGLMNYTFLWYVDSDGNTTNNCAARDNSSAKGFEFLFKYQIGWTIITKWLTGGTNPAQNQTEIKTSYRCVNGSWGLTPIPLTSSKQIMCDVVGGGMAGIDKTELSKYVRFYNKSADLRIYATVTNKTNNDSDATDRAGPFFYSQGAVDFRFEDCSNPGADSDGDGLTANNDPDCQMFLKFGYIPLETGFMCGDSIDNDGDGNTDCADSGCGYDFVCGGSGVPIKNADDKTAPKIIWLKADTFPDSAFVVFDTDEPSNGTLDFYSTNSSCKNLNKTVRDSGIWDTSIATYKTWHDAPIDNFAFNLEAIGAPLINKTTFFYKTRVCDINGNCAVSACLNFTTKSTLNDCSSCKCTLNFPFKAETTDQTDPLGDLEFVIEKRDGTNSTISNNAASGIQLNYTESKSFNLLIQNPNASNVSKWRVRLINVSITGKLSSSVLNFTGGGGMQYNSTANGSYVGMDTTKCLELINSFRPKKLEIGIPGNFTTELWHCNKGLNNCTNLASNASSLGYNPTLNMSLWVVPAEWGC